MFFINYVNCNIQMMIMIYILLRYFNHCVFNVCSIPHTSCWVCLFLMCVCLSCIRNVRVHFVLEDMSLFLFVVIENCTRGLLPNAVRNKCRAFLERRCTTLFDIIIYYDVFILTYAIIIWKHDFRNTTFSTRYFISDL